MWGVPLVASSGHTGGEEWHERWRPSGSIDRYDSEGACFFHFQAYKGASNRPAQGLPWRFSLLHGDPSFASNF